MTQFIKTVVPTDGYTEVKQVGGSYIVHLEPVVNSEDGTTSCYECTVSEEPDMAALREELAEYKAHIASLELEAAKRQKIAELEVYDDSDAVNSFTINGNPMWLTRDERTQINESVNAYEAMGATEMTKYFNGVPYTFPLTAWKQMLNALIVYASEALNVTEAHKATINNLEYIEDVNSYDFTVGYPNKLEF